jgi:hypothetical protein
MSSKLSLLALLGLVQLAGGLDACHATQQPKGGNAASNVPQSKSATPSAPVAAPAKSTAAAAVYLHRWVEPKEGACTLLLPEGWTAEGGVVRIDPRLGPTNSVGAKIDITVKKDSAGSVAIHWLPNFTYKDPHYLIGNFPVGTNYMGSMVYPLQDPQAFLWQFVFRQKRPQALNVQVVERRPLPDLARQFQQHAAASNMHYEAGALIVEYDENGTHYREEMKAVIENVVGQGLGMWTNHDSMTVRAPAAEFAQAEPLVALIVGSLQGNAQWAAGENRGAAIRAHNALESQRYLQEQRHQMVERQRETNAEARHSSWLFLTGQDDYVNPHTGEVEQGSNQYKYRWVNSGGDVIYSDNPDYDPTRDAKLRGRSDYQLSPLRAR